MKLGVCSIADSHFCCFMSLRRSESIAAYDIVNMFVGVSNKMTYKTPAIMKVLLGYDNLYNQDKINIAYMAGVQMDE